MKTLIADIECNGLLNSFEIVKEGGKLMLRGMKLWQLSIVDYETKQLASYHGDTLNAGLDRLADAPRLVFHNGLGYDLIAVGVTVGLELDWQKVVDTLVLSRLARPDRQGGHSLARWGEILGHPKPEHSDWSKWSPEMQHRCDEDVKITAEVFTRLEPMLKHYPDAVALEHQIAWDVARMSRRGIMLNVPYARELASELRTENEKIREEMERVFQPILVPADAKLNDTGKTLKVVNKRHPLHGQLEAGVPYSPLVLQEFNPASRSQVARRLMTKYGWSPNQFTPGGSPEISEETLGNLDYPEARVFASYLKTDKLLSFIEGKPSASGNGGGWLHHERNGIVYPEFRAIGTITGRPSCSNPNLQQVPRDKRLRSAFIARPGRVLVGVDASGLELRMLAHYLAKYDGGAYAEEVVNGDIHSRIRDAIGFVHHDTDEARKIGRDHTKNVEYGMIYGAGNPKLGKLAKQNARAQGVFLRESEKKLGGQIRKVVKQAIPGYGDLDEAVRTKAQRTKFIKGLDGRKIWVRQTHAALNFLLQSAGIILIKKAMVVAPRLLANHGFEEDFHYWPLLWVHDEWQIETVPEIADEIGQVFANSFAFAGEELGVHCQLDGEYKIGNTWAETH